MIIGKHLPYCWRLSRYEPILRARDAPFESWTDYSDIGSTFNGLELEPEEYLRVENLYIDAAIRFAFDSSSETFEVIYVGLVDSTGGMAVGQQILRSDFGPVVRRNLRGSLDCVLEGRGGRCQLAFGYDLYMYIAATTPCEAAVREATRAGLWVEAGIPPAYWEED